MNEGYSRICIHKAHIPYYDNERNGGNKKIVPKRFFNKMRFTREVSGMECNEVYSWICIQKAHIPCYNNERNGGHELSESDFSTKHDLPEKYQHNPHMKYTVEIMLIETTVLINTPKELKKIESCAKANVWQNMICIGEVLTTKSIQGYSCDCIQQEYTCY